MKKLTLSFWYLFCVFFLVACNKPTWWPITWLPEIFSLVPSSYDQLLYVQPDEDLRWLLTKQYWNDTPIVLEFEHIEWLLLRQSEASQVSLLFVDTTADHILDINALAPLWLVSQQPWYILKQVSDVYVYGQEKIIDTLSYDGLRSDTVTTQIKELPDDTNVIFVSLPPSSLLWGILSDFLDKLQGTVAGMKFSETLPTWEARLVFDPWFVPENTISRDAVTHVDAPISISTHALLDVLGTNTKLLAWFLPFALKPYLWEGVSLMNSEDFDIIVWSIWAILWIDMIPNPAWFGLRISFSDPTIYDIFDKIYPALDDHLTDTLLADYVVTSDKQNWLLSRTTGENNELSLASVSKSSDGTQISFLAPWSQEWDRVSRNYPWSTLMIADMDIDLLSAMFAPQAASLIDVDSDKQLHLEMLAEPEDDLIRIILK